VRAEHASRPPVAPALDVSARSLAEIGHADDDDLEALRPGLVALAPDPAALSSDRLALQEANMETMRAVAGDPYMHDPDLRTASER
jgi:hypothetical protein